MSAEALRISSNKAKQYEAYPAYVDSGVEWLGNIPDHWKTVRVKRLFRVVNGSTPKSGEPDYWDGNIPWVTPDDLGALSTTEILQPKRYITKSGYDSCGTTLVPEGSLVLSTRAPIGHLAIAGLDLCTNQGCRCLVFNNKLNRKYFYYQLIAARLELESWGQGSTFKELGKSQLEYIYLVEPPYPEQNDVTAFLDRETAKIDALIVKKEQLIELLQEKRSALINHVVTKGIDPNVPMKDSRVEWLGEIPAHWEVRPLRWAISIQSGEALKQDESSIEESGHLLIPVIGGNGLMGYTSEANTRMPAIAIGRVGALCGNVHPIDRPSWITDNALVITVNNTFHRGFLTNALFAMKLNDWATKNAQPLITGSFVKSQKAPVPPIIEQKLIEDWIEREINAVDLLIGKIHEIIDCLREYRSAIISAAVTGKIDVREEVA